MACSNVCKLCDKLIISSSVTFTAGTGLIIDIPDGCYLNNEKYCIVIAQTIPAETTITSPVFITIAGDTTTLYPLVRRNCQQATACNVRTRTKYSVCVSTNTTSGVFRLLGDIGCCGAEVLPSLPAPTTTPAVAEATTLNIRKTTKKEVTDNA
jgi:hypothetical protein